MLGWLLGAEVDAAALYLQGWFSDTHPASGWALVLFFEVSNDQSENIGLVVSFGGRGYTLNAEVRCSGDADAVIVDLLSSEVTESELQKE